MSENNCCIIITVLHKQRQHSPFGKLRTQEKKKRRSESLTEKPNNECSVIRDRTFQHQKETISKSTSKYL